MNDYLIEVYATSGKLLSRAWWEASEGNSAASYAAQQVGKNNGILIGWSGLGTKIIAVVYDDNFPAIAGIPAWTTEEILRREG